LYGKTETNYKDIKLAAPRVEFDQSTNIVTAVNEKDSLGNVIARAVFKSGNDGFQSDTIRYNFKTQRGITTNTYSKMQDLFVQAALSKKVDSVTTFAKHFTMTTCDYDDPHFGFVASKGKFINNKMVVTGPIHPEFEGVPIPVYLPFGFFPINKNRHSGLLPPQFTVNQDWGIGLTGLGYYQVLNDYVDATIKGDIYSYGGWSSNFISTYRKLYRYQGAFNLSYLSTKYNFKGDPDFRVSKAFNISWTHNMDQKARPGVNFGASVNAGSSRYNENLPNSPNRNLQNQMGSSITYSKTWKDKPFHLSVSANHNQNNTTRLINIILPDAGFTVSTIYPFQKKDAVGTPKWWEKVGVGYSTVVRNQTSFYDTAANVLRSVFHNSQWGAQHRFPISVSLPSLGPLLVSPSVSYEEVWLTNRLNWRYDPVLERVDTATFRKGLFIDRHMSFSIGMNTALFGTMQFRRGKIYAIRHTIRPNVNLTYTPNLSKKYFDYVQVDRTGRKDHVGQASGNMFSPYGYGKFGGITFGVDNNLEWKLRKKSDTTAPKRSKLIDGFGFNGGYNFLRDSLKLSDLALYARTTLFEKLSITAQGNLDPYQHDTVGAQINRLALQGKGFSLGTLRSGSISMSTSFQSKPRDGEKSGQGGQNTQQNNEIKDPTLLADRERMQDYIRRNPADFVDFNIPWQVSLSFSLNYSKTFDSFKKKYKSDLSSNTSFSGSFSLTPKWNFSTSGYYDFDTKEITSLNMSISRDMHCWQMSVSIVPVGNFKSFSINISPKSPLLQDLKVNRTRYFSSY
jgi:LPS-assembly protein